MNYVDIQVGHRLRLVKDAWIIGNWSNGSGTDMLIAANSVFVVEEVGEQWSAASCGKVKVLIYPTSNNIYCWTASMFELS